MSEIELEKEFKKCRLQEKPLGVDEEPSSSTTGVCSCPSAIVKSLSLLEVSGNKLKVKDRRNNIVRPARLRVLGNSYAKKLKNLSEKISNSGGGGSNNNSDDATGIGDIVRNITGEKVDEEFTSEAFQKMRISSTPHESPSHLSHTPESPASPALLSGDPTAEERLPSTSTSSSSLNCSTQAKLQQQMSTSEFDSTIDEMSDFLAYHLSLFNHRDKYLIDSMYT